MINVFEDVLIEDNVLIADKVNFITNEHIYDKVDVAICNQGVYSRPIRIGGTWIGINATILAGTQIGRNCVVGANAVVKGQFPDYCIIAGNPARIIKRYNLEEEKWERC